VAFRADVSGANTGPLGNENFAVMEDAADDNLVWYQNGEPGSLYCSDETDGESLRACMQTHESLLAYEIGGTLVEPSLAASWEATDDLLTWTFTLQEGVTFHDGSALDANDVVLSYAVEWDAAHPLHTGRTGNFDYWSGLFGAFLNPPAAE
jgi:ABC-type transport system substrate-binding protein